MSSCVVSGYRKMLVLVIVVVASHQVFGTCPLNHYYDYHMEQCHPCSDCDYPRTPNQFCLKDCPSKRCEPGKYFDTHTQNCHLCTECKPPLTPNEFCQAQCTDDERYGRTTATSSLLVATSGTKPLPGITVDNIIIIVLCSVMGTVILVLLILGLLHWRKCLCKDKRQSRSHLPEHDQQQESFIKNDLRNGQHSVNMEMHSLPAPRSDEPLQIHTPNFSLPIQSNNQTTGNCLQQGVDSVALADDRDRTPSTTPLGSESSAALHLVETSTRMQHSLTQDRSLKGNVVCQPESEEPDRCRLLPSVCQGNRDAGEVHGMLSPSSTRDAERPHLSFDPNKDCGYEDHVFPDSRSSTNNGYAIQTSLKSSC